MHIIDFTYLIQVCYVVASSLFTSPSYKFLKIKLETACIKPVDNLQQTF